MKIMLPGGPQIATYCERQVKQPDFDAAETGMVRSWGLSLRRPGGLVLLQNNLLKYKLLLSLSIWGLRALKKPVGLV